MSASEPASVRDLLSRQHQPARVGYVVKRYPRYSETFIVTEILAHEAAGLDVEIFALASPLEPHFQDCIARVRAPVTYLSAEAGRVAEFWATLGAAADVMPEVWAALASGRHDPGRDVHQALLLALAVKAKGVKHLHAHFASAAASVARLAAKFAGVPFTFTAHAKDIFHEAVREEDLRRKLREAAAVVTVSDYNARHLRERFGADAAKVTRVYNGLELDRLAYREPRDRPRVVLGVGRLVEKKGFSVLVEACAILASRGRDFACHIVGNGDQEQALREQIARPGLEGRVRLLGSRPQAEVFEQIRGAAVLAAPCVVAGDSNRDGLPTVLLEAMALGTPCVSTDVTGIPEAVRHGQTGLIAPQRDPAGLADAIERLLDDPAARLRLAAAARRIVEAEFDAGRNSAKLREIFAASGRRPYDAEGDDGAARTRLLSENRVSTAV